MGRQNRQLSFSFLSLASMNRKVDPPRESRHLLAGGKTVGEVLKLADEAEKVRSELVRFCE